MTDAKGLAQRSLVLPESNSAISEGSCNSSFSCAYSWCFRLEMTSKDVLNQGQVPSNTSSMEVLVEFSKMKNGVFWEQLDKGSFQLEKNGCNVLTRLFEWCFRQGNAQFFESFGQVLEKCKNVIFREWVNQGFSAGFLQLLGVCNMTENDVCLLFFVVLASRSMDMWDVVVE